MVKSMKNRMKIISAVTVASILLASIPPIPAEATACRQAGAVSYLNNSLASKSVPLNPIDDNIDIKIVPSEELMFDAEVLSSQVNPSQMCKGSSMTKGGFVCSNVSTKGEVTGFLNGSTFSRSCQIMVVEATYPKFFRGGDFNKDGRIDIYKGEWPSFSDATGQTQPDAKFVRKGGKVEIIPGDEYHLSMSINHIPNGNVKPPTDGSEPTAAKFVPKVTGAGNSIDEQASASSESDSYIAFPPQGCDESPLTSIATNCESGRKAFHEWSSWSNPRYRDNSEEKDTDEKTENPSDIAGTSTACRTVNGQSNCGIPFWYPDNEKRLARKPASDITCPSVQYAPSSIACINAFLVAFGWMFKFSGILQNLGCMTMGNCYENVQVMMNVESLTGSNQGCEEPCGDVYSDTLISSQNPPNHFKECNNYGTGQNSPCWPDYYVGTRGICNVCGDDVGCTFVWKNWVRDNYVRQRTENGPCGDDDKITYKGVTYSMCDVDEYVNYVIARSESM